MKKYWFILVCICLLNCQPIHHQTLPETVKYERPTLNSLRELIQSIKVVRLDDQNKITLGRFLHILHRDSSFYVGDLSGTRLIYRFKENGQFLDSIGKLGKGPGEYINLTDFYVGDSTQNLYILSYPDTRIYQYDKNGRFINLKTVLNRSESFTKIKDRFWIQLGFNNGYIPERVAQYDTNLNLLHAFLPLETKTMNLTLGPSFLECQNQHFLFMGFNPNIYQIEGDSIFPILSFDYGEKAIPESYWKRTDAIQAASDLQNKGFCNIHTVAINDRYIITEHIEQTGMENAKIYFLYSIKNRETGKWDWIRHEAPDLNHQTISSPEINNWYSEKIKGFTKDGRLMIFMNCFELSALSDADKALITNPEQLQNANPETGIFLFLCTLK